MPTGTIVGPLNAGHVHYGEPCDCVDAIVRIERRFAERRSVDLLPRFEGERRAASDRRAS